MSVTHEKTMLKAFDSFDASTVAQRALALAPDRIRVNGIAIGSVMSASLQAALKENPDWRSDIAERTPLGRIAAPAELVETALFLASEGSSFITGQVLTVDGGRGLLDAIAAPGY